MKIENDDNKIIVYVFNEKIDINNIDSLNKKIKDIFVKIMKRYNYDFFGYNKVSVYHNDNYGFILEVEKIYNSVYNYQTIDLKIIIYKNVNIFLEFEDYYFTNLKYKNNKFYLEITDDVDIIKYIEFGKIKYKKLLNEID